MFLESASNCNLNDWSPSADLGVLACRARLLAEIRDYFSRTGVMEVETPVLSQGATTDPSIESFSVPCGGNIRYLHTSPEFAMKRLLCAGSGDIYQICRVFRGDEQGRFHNPEFTLLEWYRVDWDDRQLAEEVIELIALLNRTLATNRPIRVQYMTYGQAFQKSLGVDPYTVSLNDLSRMASASGLSLQTDLTRDGYLDFLMSALVAPGFPADQLTVLNDYPVSQAALARIRASSPPVAARFEVYAGSLELANGFHELKEPEEQQDRFEADEKERAQAGLPVRPYDRRLIAALNKGLPDCAGVAMGIDRLLLWLMDGERLSEMVAFSWERA